MSSKSLPLLGAVKPGVRGCGTRPLEEKSLGKRDVDRNKKFKGASMSQKENTETELKLAGPAEKLEALWQETIAPEVAPVSKKLVSTYFDTSDYSLRRRGFTLRVRQKGDHFEQTVKAEGSAQHSLMERGEWTAPVDGPEPDLKRFDAKVIGETIGLVVAGDLRPIFTTEIDRQVKEYRIGPEHMNGHAFSKAPRGGKKAKGVKDPAAGGALVEAAWDRGEVRADGRREAISEIELELVEGSASALRHEGVRLHDATPLEFQPLSKAARGFNLALGQHPVAIKGRLPSLTPDQTVETALQQILTSCVNHWHANHAAAFDGRDIEGIHQLRVSLRRFRSALTLFKDVLPPKDLTWLQGEAKAIINGLGGARDWDVFITELLQPVMDARPHDKCLMRLYDAVVEEQRLAYAQARQTLSAPGYLKFILDLGVWLDQEGWCRKKNVKALRASPVDFARKVLHKRQKKVLKQGTDFEHLPDEELHRLRISLKKLRYATEFFVSLYDDTLSKSYVKAMRRLQDDLGHLNDLAVAETRLLDLCHKHQAGPADELRTAMGTLIGWYSHSLMTVRPQIVQDWEKFICTEPFWQKN